MGTRPSQPRIEPVDPATPDERVREALALVGGAGDLPGTGPVSPTLNVFSTLARHPGLFRRWFPFAGKLLGGRLPARDRELLILRSAWQCRSDYEWGQHVVIARAAGLSDEEIARVAAGPGAHGWDAADAALLRAVDELHDDACITDATWRTLAGRYDERQLIEVPMLIGHYHLLAFALNSFGVQREPGIGGLPDGPEAG